MSEPPSVPIERHRPQAAVVTAGPRWQPNVAPWSARQRLAGRLPVPCRTNLRGKYAPVQSNLGAVSHASHEKPITPYEKRGISTLSYDGAFPARVDLLEYYESSVSPCCAWETTVEPRVAVAGRSGGPQMGGAPDGWCYRVVTATGSWQLGIGRPGVAGSRSLAAAPRWPRAGPARWVGSAARLALGDAVDVARSGRAGLAGCGGPPRRGA
jgi:hypothetical protein